MSPRLRRSIITLFVVGVAIGLVVTVIFSRQGSTPTPTPGAADGTSATGTPDPAATAAGTEPLPGDAPAGDQAAAVDPPPPAETAETGSGEAVGIEGLRAVPAPAPDGPLDPIGSLDPRVSPIEVTFTPIGAGIARIAMSSEWDTAANKIAAEAHWNAVADGAADPPPLPADEHRHVLVEQREAWSSRAPLPVLGAYGLEVDGAIVNLFFDTDESGARVPVWTNEGPGAFVAEIRNAEDDPVLRVRRTFELSPTGDITLRQSVENLSGRQLQIRWIQYGPAELERDEWGYIDRRRFRFGHQWDRDPKGNVYADRGLLVERIDVFKKFEDSPLWPNEDSIDEGYHLSWFASVNRYFGLAVHPVYDADHGYSKSLTDVIETIGHETTAPDDKTGVVLTQFFSPRRMLEPDATTSFDLGIYAGPLERDVFKAEPYASLNMGELILYQMSNCCMICTFPWLAKLLLSFLSLVEGIVGDWGIAIILLVCVVRLLLHPLTKRGQISMQRFSKQMTELKPEIDKLQKKYKDDQKRLQQEQMRMMRERGVNPIQFLGCAPMFLQMPIWIALYAMLYFAKEIQQQPAFFGIFQKVTGGRWEFLADLSRADRFIALFDDPKTVSLFLQFDYSSINILPLLMGVLFYVQQKYMSPPPSPSMTKEQLQQQKIMKIMMVVMMPIFLYSAPSGLTLYILTSSTIGILESKRIRAHVDQMDLSAPAKKKVKATKTKTKRSRDAIGKAYAEALERRKQQQAAKQQKPKSYKKRKKGK